MIAQKLARHQTKGFECPEVLVAMVQSCFRHAT